MSQVVQRYVAKDDDGIRLDRWFKRHYPHVVHSALEKLLRTGQVRVDGGRAKANIRLEKGQTIRVPPLPKPVEEGVEVRKSEANPKDKAFVRSLTVYEDDDILVVNKPHGLAVQGGSKTDRHLDGLLTAAASDGQRPRLVHRLDRDTSGVMVLGKTPAAAAHLAKAFRQRETKKLYWAMTHGVPNPRVGRIDLALSKQMGTDGRERVRISDPDGEVGQHAVTRYAVVDHAADEVAFVALMPVTGRTHQVRAHCAAIGAPVIGDPKYGGAASKLRGALDKRLHLHARALRIEHPNGKIMTFTAPPSAHLAKAMDIFGFKPDQRSDPFSIFPDKESKKK
jgi:23S rRNA pseudouridine955/2504/2580 synthase